MMRKISSSDGGGGGGGGGGGDGDGGGGGVSVLRLLPTSEHNVARKPFKPDVAKPTLAYHR